ncbi:HpcH/HpaI aldolase/citrate lyase family protein [Corynebacterium anserum]|uniref:CoA ester lyase n=1 Tax=Corynebacterium anserum TaxID=2684406 RepID=A0A7G7YPJ9_9CORY|nr:CoA ester lyase [Corynebacterium anserum]MBC2682050.1 CoA ester lyase [Corynebacterium anserum]QNH96419.1 CoA ester lyase [Corynebacterium anserum]
MTWIPQGPALLFAPADRPERFTKAAQRSDMVILDLEDGCRRENRPQARENVRTSTLDPMRTIVRINPPGTPDFAPDIEAVAQSPFRQVMLPKAEDLSIFHSAPAEIHDWQIIALIETPLGVLNAREVASHPQVVALFWGAEDLTAALGGTSSRYGVDEHPVDGGGVSGHPGGYREVPRLTRALVLLHSAAAGKVALDAIHADTADVDGARAEAVDAAASGFAATVSIHPGLVPAIREAYQPTDEQKIWAQKVADGAARNTGAFAVDGQMIDAPLRRQAEVILARAGGDHT